MHCKSTAHQLLCWMQDVEAVLILIAEVLARQDGEDLFHRESAGAFDQQIGHLRPPIREAFERIVDREGEHLLACELEQLRFGGGRRDEADQCGAGDPFGNHSGSSYLEIVKAACIMARV